MRYEHAEIDSPSTNARGEITYWLGAGGVEVAEAAVAGLGEGLCMPDWSVGDATAPLLPLLAPPGVAEVAMECCCCWDDACG